VFPPGVGDAEEGALSVALVALVLFVAAESHPCISSSPSLALFF
jgi:hypothetical protein